MVLAAKFRKNALMHGLARSLLEYRLGHCHGWCVSVNPDRARIGRVMGAVLWSLGEYPRLRICRVAIHHNRFKKSTAHIRHMDSNRECALGNGELSEAICQRTLAVLF